MTELETGQEPPMEDGKWATGSLRITSETVTAREVTARLGIEPDRAFEKGSLYSPRNPTSRRREASVWILESGLETSRPLHEHVEVLVSRVRERHDVLDGLAGECFMDLFLGYSSENGQGSCELSAPLLKEIGTLGLDMVMDLCPPAVDDDEDEEEHVEHAAG